MNGVPPFAFRRNPGKRLMPRFISHALEIIEIFLCRWRRDDGSNRNVSPFVLPLEDVDVTLPGALRFIRLDRRKALRPELPAGFTHDDQPDSVALRQVFYGAVHGMRHHPRLQLRSTEHAVVCRLSDRDSLPELPSVNGNRERNEHGCDDAADNALDQVHVLLEYSPFLFPSHPQPLAGRACVSTGGPHPATVLPVPLRLTRTLFRPALGFAFEENH
jgi:hypothetical protein